MLSADHLKLARHTLFLTTPFLLLNGLFGQNLPPVPSSLVIADGTPVKLRLNETVSSAHVRVGDRLDFLVTTDVTAEGFTIIPAGNTAEGTVIAVKGKRFLGIGGKVVFRLDSVELVTGDRVGLRARKEVKGRSHTKFMAAGIVGVGIWFWPAAPVFLLTRGGDSTVLKGTELTGHITGDVRVMTANLPKATDDASQLKDVMSFVPPRVVNGEGREGDLVNLLFVAQADDLQQAFLRGGWIKTDRWRPVMVWHLLRHMTHDAKLPMARFYLFGRVQDYSYALPDPAAVVTRRHHLRIWKTDYKVDGNPVWAAAAIHDVAISLVRHGLFISHRIDPNVDAERDFVGKNLATTQLVVHQEYVRGADPIFEAQTAAGEAYHSDSRILLLDLHKTIRSKVDLPDAASGLLGSTPVTSLTADGTTPY